MNTAGAGLGAQAATRPETQIRTKTNHLEQLIGRLRVVCNECEQFRGRVAGYYDEQPVPANSPAQPVESRTDLDELQFQLHSLENTCDVLENHLREIQTV
jgi:hypothetical protein